MAKLKELDIEPKANVDLSVNVLDPLTLIPRSSTECLSPSECVAPVTLSSGSPNPSSLHLEDREAEAATGESGEESANERELSRIHTAYPSFFGGRWRRTDYLTNMTAFKEALATFPDASVSPSASSIQ